MSEQPQSEIANLTSAEFGAARQIHVEFARPGSAQRVVERFVITWVGRMAFAVDIETGSNYTRPQLIERFKPMAATCRLIQKSE